MIGTFQDSHGSRATRNAGHTLTPQAEAMMTTIEPTARSVADLDPRHPIERLAQSLGTLRPWLAFPYYFVATIVAIGYWVVRGVIQGGDDEADAPR